MQSHRPNHCSLLGVINRCRLDGELNWHEHCHSHRVLALPMLLTSNTLLYSQVTYIFFCKRLNNFKSKLLGMRVGTGTCTMLFWLPMVPSTTHIIFAKASKKYSIAISTLYEECQIFNTMIFFIMQCYALFIEKSFKSEWD